MDELERLYEPVYLLPVGIVAFDEHGVIEAANPMSVQLLNPYIARADVADAYRFLAPLAADLGAMVAQHDGGGVVLAHHRTTLGEGTGRETTVELSVHRSRPGYYLAVLSDVTALVRRERELRRERDRIRIIVEMVREYAIYTIDRSGSVDSWNASGERLFGIPADDAVGHSLADIVVVGDLCDVMDASIFAGRHRIEGWTVTGPAGPFFADTMISTLVDDTGRPEGFIVITRDASEMRRREEELRKEADTDPLTSLANRRGFDVRGRRLLATCELNGTTASVLMIDIDHFKAVNDNHGHDGGDAVLRAVGAALACQVRAIDLIGRRGGEEFVVLLPGADRTAGATRAEALRAAIAALDIELAPGTSVAVTISVGVAEHHSDLAHTLRRADDAMYVAKRTGRNRVAVDG